MKIVSRHSHPDEAFLTVTRLESCGIEAYVEDEYTISLNWLYSNALGGVKVVVNEEDYEEAREILNVPPIEGLKVRCPHCGSESLTRLQMDRLNALGIMLFSICFPMQDYYFICNDCKKRFGGKEEALREDNAEQLEELERAALSVKMEDSPVPPTPWYVRAFLKGGLFGIVVMLILLPAKTDAGGFEGVDGAVLYFGIGFILGGLVSLLGSYSDKAKRKGQG